MSGDPSESFVLTPEHDGPPKSAPRFPVRLGNQLLICELNDRGEIEVPLGAMIDIELTGLIEGLLKEAGIPGEDVEDTMNALRVQYVMGRDVTVEAASKMLDEQPYAEGGEEL